MRTQGCLQAYSYLSSWCQEEKYEGTHISGTTKVIWYGGYLKRIRTITYIAIATTTILSDNLLIYVYSYTIFIIN